MRPLLMYQFLVSVARCSTLGPNMDLWQDRGFEMFPAGIFTGKSKTKLSLTSLLEPIGDTSKSTVYPIAGYGGKWAVKYTMFCPVDGLDPVERESTFLKLVNRNAPSVALRHLYTSESIALPDQRGKISRLHIDCGGGTSLPRVRYIITEKVGLNLHQIGLRNGNQPVHIVAALGIQMIRLVKQLHAMNIVHGDIHPGNVAVSLRKPRNLILIDFGSAMFPLASLREQDFMDDSNGEEMDPDWVSCHPFLSVWESEGQPASFRDDVYRVVQSMAVLMHGIGYAENMAMFCHPHATVSDTMNYLEVKRKHNLFDTTFRVSDHTGVENIFSYPIESAKGVNPINIRVIRNLFEALMAAVRHPESPFDKPDYELIEYLLTQLVSVSSHPGCTWTADPAFVHFHD